MDPPTPPQPTPAPPISAPGTAMHSMGTAAAAAAAAAYSDSIDSSPRSRTADSYLDDPSSALLSSKLRLMCSYGGHIVPRPHDKSLCYVGGDTRIVVVDRHISLSSLCSRLSNTLLNGRAFTLKYQLPSEELDSLISVTTDEDLDNMIDEYDRSHSNNSSKTSRLRLFLFSVKPESSQSIGPLFDSTAKTEGWFVNALNGNTLNRGFLDSASVNCLLDLDDDSITNPISNSNSNIDLVGSDGSGEGREMLGNKNMKQSGPDVQSVPDSPMMEMTSSFGSASSSPSLANLPPIRVHVDGGGREMEQKVIGIEEQFAHISVAGQKQEGGDGGFLVLSSPPPLSVSIMPVSSAVMAGGSGGDHQGNHPRFFADDERSDHSVPVGATYRKQPPIPTQTQQKIAGGSSGGGAIDLASPDSISSDSSLSNAINRQEQPFFYQDPIMQVPSGVNMVPASANPVDPKINSSDPKVLVHIQDSGYVLRPQFDQQQPKLAQQFIHAGAHYIHHHPTAAVPIPTYYSVYPPHQQQHQLQQQHYQQHHPQLDQQYPVYYLQAQQPQAYNVSIQQPNISESVATIPSSLPQAPPNPAMVPPSASFNPIRNATIAKPEMAATTMYRTTTDAPQLVQVSSSQHHQQYMGYSQVHHPPQSVAANFAGTTNYAYEFADPAHAQIYYTQPLAPNMPLQYQTTSLGAEASDQHPTDGIKQQQIRTSQ